MGINLCGRAIVAFYENIAEFTEWTIEERRKQIEVVVLNA